MNITDLRVGVLTNNKDQEIVLVENVRQAGHVAYVPEEWNEESLTRFLDENILDVVVCPESRPNWIPGCDKLFAMVRERHPIVKRVKVVAYAKKNFWGVLRFDPLSKKNCDAVILNSVSPNDFRSLFNALYGFGEK